VLVAQIDLLIAQEKRLRAIHLVGTLALVSTAAVLLGIYVAAGQWQDLLSGVSGAVALFLTRQPWLGFTAHHNRITALDILRTRASTCDPASPEEEQVKHHLEKLLVSMLGVAP
jgi:hypothetical protein